MFGWSSSSWLWTTGNISKLCRYRSWL
ncbi:hypothetical protein BLA29_015037 [Euroglyphus maynei]|uniref:Uncharacterized protein n=1 Tax=Euroglyphus maynei TaxID=6958 RepID=A0A1Y3AWE7_EURMA|nr:hypothetical protein BLA29_015037 [Euroglyphus maynei]